MLKIFLKIRYLTEYVFALGVWGLLNIQPHFILKPLARLTAGAAYLFPAVYKLVEANIQVCFPEMPKSEVRRIGKTSVFNAFLNMLEFFWMSNSRKRIGRCLECVPESGEELSGCIERNEQIIFVNPHLGSWEASALAVPYFFPIKLAAIAHPLKNPYVNSFLNSGNREQVSGLKIIFSRGAVRASIKALRKGYSIGTPIDQNTKIREGGVFVNFFGLPVPSSKSPAEFSRFCRDSGIKSRVFFGLTLRGDDGKLHARCMPLSKPEAEYSTQEMIQELMSITEEYIRKHPDQYIWLYRRFAHIPRGLDEKTAKRFPYYSRLVKESFYSKVKKVDVNEYLPH